MLPFAVSPVAYFVAGYLIRRSLDASGIAERGALPALFIEPTLLMLPKGVKDRFCAEICVCSVSRVPPTELPAFPNELMRPSEMIQGTVRVIRHQRVDAVGSNRAGDHLGRSWNVTYRRSGASKDK
ncbi:MAG: hypothetical protein XXXNARYT_003650 [Candidatus Accumulibacter regalis]|jgi:hypothetical protein